MAYLITCAFHPGGGELRIAHRVPHIEYMIDNLDRTVAGGPLLEDDGTILGMYVVLNVDEREEAVAFIRQEPYSAAGLFADVKINRTRVMTPEPEPGYLKAELAKQIEEDARIT